MQIRLTRDVEELKAVLRDLHQSLEALKEDISRTDDFRAQDYCPAEVLTGTEKETAKRCRQLVEELTRNHYRVIEREKELRETVNRFTGNFSEQNTFHFRTRLATQEDFLDFASDLADFIDNDKIVEFERRSNKAYTDIIRQIGKEVADMMSREGAILRVINDINNDFVERNFAGVIKSISLRAMPSENKVMQLMQTIRDFNDEHEYSLGNLFEGITPFFVCRYPQTQSKDLVRWLSSVTNPYLHYGDFDPAGLNVFSNEFLPYLPGRGHYFVPDRLEEWLEKGNRERYDRQSLHLSPECEALPEVRRLVRLLHTYKRGVDQETLIR